jgi:hypothetical protein
LPDDALKIVMRGAEKGGQGCCISVGVTHSFAS